MITYPGSQPDGVVQWATQLAVNTGVGIFVGGAAQFVRSNPLLGVLGATTGLVAGAARPFFQEAVKKLNPEPKATAKKVYAAFIGSVVAGLVVGYPVTRIFGPSILSAAAKVMSIVTSRTFFIPASIALGLSLLAGVAYNYLNAEKDPNTKKPG